MFGASQVLQNSFTPNEQEVCHQQEHGKDRYTNILTCKTGER